MATGLGSPDGAALSAALVAASAPTGDATAITAIASLHDAHSGGGRVHHRIAHRQHQSASLLGGRQLTLTGSYTLAGQVHQVT